MNVYAVVSGCWWARSCSSAGMDDSITGIALPFRRAVVSSHRIVLPVGPQTPQQALPTLRPTSGSPAVRPVEAAPCRKIPREVGAGGAKKLGATKASVSAFMVFATPLSQPRDRVSETALVR
jgi:hypothetical protein